MKIKTNLWRQDIRKHEYAIGFTKAAGIVILMLYVFYDSFLPAPLLLPVWVLYIKEWSGDISKKKEQEFRMQFRDSIQALSLIHI